MSDIKTWVEQLRHREHIAPGVTFTISKDVDGTPVGLIDDPVQGETFTLLPSDFLVFGCGRLRVLSQQAFNRDYRDIPRRIL